MDKQELYNSIVQLTVETGQGLTGVVGKMKPNVQLLLDSLVEDGYITKHDIRFNYLPDDSFYMPKGCYNMYLDDDKRALAYVRMFLKIDDQGANVRTTDFLDDVEFMVDYANWLKKNQKELLKLKNLKTIALSKSKNSHPFSSSELQTLRSRKWFKKNLDVNECLVKIREWRAACEDMHRVLQQLLDLYKRDSKKYVENLRDETEKFERNKIELSVFKKFETFFGDKKGKIQSVIPMATTTMPKDDWGVHESHCCSTHGCKYMDDQCPVALDIVDQKHDCEYCQKD